MASTNLIGGSLTVTPDGELLRELRLKEGKTQKQVEDEAGIPSPRLSTYEASQSISLDHIHKLSVYFKMSVRVLTKPDSADTGSKLGTRLVGYYGWWEGKGTNHK